MLHDLLVNGKNLISYLNRPNSKKKEVKVPRPILTLLYNGILTQNYADLLRPTCFIGQPHYTPHPEKLSISLQDHGNKVRFRNIWTRDL